MDALDQKGQASTWKGQKDSLTSFKISSLLYLFLKLVRISLKYYSCAEYLSYIKAKMVRFERDIINYLVQVHTKNPKRFR